MSTVFEPLALLLPLVPVLLLLLLLPHAAIAIAAPASRQPVSALLEKPHTPPLLRPQVL